MSAWWWMVPLLVFIASCVLAVRAALSDQFLFGPIKGFLWLTAGGLFAIAFVIGHYV